MEIILGFLVLVYLVDIVALFYYGLHCYIMVYLFRKNGASCQSGTCSIDLKKKPQKDWPVVTLQLPVFNEYYVVERLLDSIAALDYPKKKMEIQLLDDSTDESAIVGKKKVEALKKKGYDVKYIHRENRKDHKAGALREAMDVAKGEFLAIFDADFIPSKDFLKKTVPFFLEDSKIGMVQTRWGHVNGDYSMLTKAQRLGIDAHFIVEQVARNGSDLWMNFNGTAGIWRKETIYDAGNWSGDTLTEDFDLSYRAELSEKGWKFKYLEDVVNPAELPATISAYKTQQFRWCKGSIQTAVKLIPTIFKSKENWKIKAEAITHLTNYAVHPLMVINILTTLPLLAFHEMFLELSTAMLFGLAVFLSVGTFGPMALYAFAQKHVNPKGWLKTFSMMPVMMMIGTGIAISNTKAFIEAIIGKKSSFVRTPKLRLETAKDKVDERNKYAELKLDKVAILEFFMAVYIIFTIVVAFQVDKILVVPFLFIYAGGFLYVSFATLIENVKIYLKNKAEIPAVNKVTK